MGKEQDLNKVKISKKRHIIKAISWNLLAMATTAFVLTYLPPKFGFQPLDKESVGWLVFVDRIAKLILYYGHERAWFTSSWGVVRPQKD